MELGERSPPLDRAPQDRGTIVALATPPGQGALATVRMSGPRVRTILERVLRHPGSRLPAVLEPRRATLALFVDPDDGATIDEVVVTLFAAPRSFTGEDVAELTLHGGPWLVGEAIRVLTSLGADHARPGEFTRRAFVAGKLDLARAEAIQALVVAQSSAAAKIAARHLSGELSQRYAHLRRDLVSIAARLEGPLEFPDDTGEAEGEAATEASALLVRTRHTLGGLVRSRTRARRIVEGIAVPIIGRPNAGKSSLFNALLGSSRAIVTAQPGTTRDCIEAPMTIQGRLIRLIDTAGLGMAVDGVDAEAMRRTELRIREADVVILVLDRSQPADERDRDLVSRVAERPIVIAWSKSDLEPSLHSSSFEELALPSTPVAISALDGTGVGELMDRLARVVEELAPVTDGPEGTVSSARQQALLARALGELERAQENVDLGRAELAIEDIRHAELDLAEILGDSSPDEVLDEVFRNFCIGK